MTKLILALSLLTLSLFPSHVDRKGKTIMLNSRSTITNKRVKDTHQAMFGPNAIAQWKHTSNGLWRGDFEFKGKQVAAFYAQDGSYIAHTLKQKLSDLPEKLRLTLQSQFEPHQLTTILAHFSPDEAAWYIQVNAHGTPQVYKAFSYGRIIPHNNPIH